MAHKDYNIPSHPNLPNVKNLHVIKTMTSLKSRGYVTETFTWGWYYWYITNEGIVYLRDVLHIPEHVIPQTLNKVSERPQTVVPKRRLYERDRVKSGDEGREGYRRAGAGRGEAKEVAYLPDRREESGPARAERDGYKRGEKEEKYVPARGPPRFIKQGEIEVTAKRVERSGLISVQKVESAGSRVERSGPNSVQKVESAGSRVVRSALISVQNSESAESRAQFKSLNSRPVQHSADPVRRVKQGSAAGPVWGSEPIQPSMSRSESTTCTWETTSSDEPATVESTQPGPGFRSLKIRTAQHTSSAKKVEPGPIWGTTSPTSLSKIPEDKSLKIRALPKEPEKSSHSEPEETPGNQSGSNQLSVEPGFRSLKIRPGEPAASPEASADTQFRSLKIRPIQHPKEPDETQGSDNQVKSSAQPVVRTVKIRRSTASTSSVWSAEDEPSVKLLIRSKSCSTDIDEGDESVYLAKSLDLFSSDATQSRFKPAEYEHTNAPSYRPAKPPRSRSPTSPSIDHAHDYDTVLPQPFRSHQCLFTDMEESPSITESLEDEDCPGMEISHHHEQMLTEDNEDISLMSSSTHHHNREMSTEDYLPEEDLPLISSSTSHTLEHHSPHHRDRNLSNPVSKQLQQIESPSSSYDDSPCDDVMSSPFGDDVTESFYGITSLEDLVHASEANIIPVSDSLAYPEKDRPGQVRPGELSVITKDPSRDPSDPRFSFIKSPEDQKGWDLRKPARPEKWSPKKPPRPTITIKGTFNPKGDSLFDPIKFCTVKDTESPLTEPDMKTPIVVVTPTTPTHITYQFKQLTKTDTSRTRHVHAGDTSCSILVQPYADDDEDSDVSNDSEMLQILSDLGMVHEEREDEVPLISSGSSQPLQQAHPTAGDKRIKTDDYNRFMEHYAKAKQLERSLEHEGQHVTSTANEKMKAYLADREGQPGDEMDSDVSQSSKVEAGSDSDASNTDEMFGILSDLGIVEVGGVPSTNSQPPIPSRYSKVLSDTDRVEATEDYDSESGVSNDSGMFALLSDAAIVQKIDSDSDVSNNDEMFGILSDLGMVGTPKLQLDPKRGNTSTSSQLTLSHLGVVESPINVFNRSPKQFTLQASPTTSSDELDPNWTTKASTSVKLTQSHVKVFNSSRSSGNKEFMLEPSPDVSNNSEMMNIVTDLGLVEDRVVGDIQLQEGPNSECSCDGEGHHHEHLGEDADYGRDEDTEIHKNGADTDSDVSNSDEMFGLLADLGMVESTPAPSVVTSMVAQHGSDTESDVSNNSGMLDILADLGMVESKPPQDDSADESNASNCGCDEGSKRHLLESDTDVDSIVSNNSGMFEILADLGFVEHEKKTPAADKSAPSPDKSTPSADKSAPSADKIGPSPDTNKASAASKVEQESLQCIPDPVSDDESDVSNNDEMFGILADLGMVQSTAAPPKPNSRPSKPSRVTDANSSKVKSEPLKATSYPSKHFRFAGNTNTSAKVESDSESDVSNDSGMFAILSDLGMIAAEPTAAGVDGYTVDPNHDVIHSDSSSTNDEGMSQILSDLGMASGNNILLDLGMVEGMLGMDNMTEGDLDAMVDMAGTEGISVSAMMEGYQTEMLDCEDVYETDSGSDYAVEEELTQSVMCAPQYGGTPVPLIAQTLDIMSLDSSEESDLNVEEETEKVAKSTPRYLMEAVKPLNSSNSYRSTTFTGTISQLPASLQDFSAPIKAPEQQDSNSKPTEHDDSDSDVSNDSGMFAILSDLGMVGSEDPDPISTLQQTESLLSELVDDQLNDGGRELHGSSAPCVPASLSPATDDKREAATPSPGIQLSASATPEATTATKPARRPSQIAAAIAARQSSDKLTAVKLSATPSHGTDAHQKIYTEPSEDPKQSTPPASESSPGITSRLPAAASEDPKQSTPLSSPRITSRLPASASEDPKQSTRPASKSSPDTTSLLPAAAPEDPKQSTPLASKFSPGTTSRLPAAAPENPKQSIPLASKSSPGTTSRLPAAASEDLKQSTPPASKSSPGTTSRLPASAPENPKQSIPLASKSSPGTTSRLPAAAPENPKQSIPLASKSSPCTTSRLPAAVSKDPKQYTGPALKSSPETTSQLPVAASEDPKQSARLASKSSPGTTSRLIPAAAPEDPKQSTRPASKSFPGITSRLPAAVCKDPKQSPPLASKSSPGTASRLPAAAPEDPKLSTPPASKSSPGTASRLPAAAFEDPKQSIPLASKSSPGTTSRLPAAAYEDPKQSTPLASKPSLGTTSRLPAAAFKDPKQSTGPASKSSPGTTFKDPKQSSPPAPKPSLGTTSRLPAAASEDLKQSTPPASKSSPGTTSRLPASAPENPKQSIPLASKSSPGTTSRLPAAAPENPKQSIPLASKSSPCTTSRLPAAVSKDPKQYTGPALKSSPETTSQLPVAASEDPKQSARLASKSSPGTTSRLIPAAAPEDPKQSTRPASKSFPGITSRLPAAVSKDPKQSPPLASKSSPGTASRLPAAAPEDPKLSTPPASKSSPGTASRLPAAAFEDPKQSIPLASKSSPGTTSRLPAAAYEDPKQSTPLASKPSLGTTSRLPAAAFKDPKQSTGPASKSSPGTTSRLPAAAFKDPKQSSPPAPKPSLGTTSLLPAAASEDPKQSTPLALKSSPGTASRLPAAAPEDPKQNTPLASKSSPGTTSRLPAAAHEDPKQNTCPASKYSPETTSRLPVAASEDPEQSTPLAFNFSPETASLLPAAAFKDPKQSTPLASKSSPGTASRLPAASPEDPKQSTPLASKYSPGTTSRLPAAAHEDPKQNTCPASKSSPGTTSRLPASAYEDPKQSPPLASKFSPGTTEVAAGAKQSVFSIKTNIAAVTVTRTLPAPPSKPSPGTIVQSCATPQTSSPPSSTKPSTPSATVKDPSSTESQPVTTPLSSSHPLPFKHSASATTAQPLPFKHSASATTARPLPFKHSASATTAQPSSPDYRYYTDLLID